MIHDRSAGAAKDWYDTPPSLGYHGPIAFTLSITILLLCLLDGVLTLVLLESPRQEANPLMAYLLGRGVLWFLLGKYALTAVALAVLLIFKDRRMFGTGYRVAVLLPVFVGLYGLLTAGQLALLFLHTPAPIASTSPPEIAGGGPG